MNYHLEYGNHIMIHDKKSYFGVMGVEGWNCKKCGIAIEIIDATVETNREIYWKMINSSWNYSNPPISCEEVFMNEALE